MTLDPQGPDLEFGDAEHRLRAYFAAPAAGYGPGALVLGSSESSREHLRDVCDHLARAGFAALAPDPAEAAADSTLDHAIFAILSCDAVIGARVAAVGFGDGGARARRLAARSTRIGAVAHFPAGRGDFDADDGETAVPLLRFVAADEAAAPDSDVPPSRPGARAAIRILPGVRPDYMDATRPDVHDAAAASESWSALVAFLRAELP